MLSLPQLNITIELLHKKACLPHRAHPTDACFDLTACENLEIAVGATGLARLGWAMELEGGWEARIRGRSGLASKGILAHHGTIDHLYRKEVKVILHNFSSESFKIKAGDRIAQLSFAPVYPVTLAGGQVTLTERGGFGSTGQ